jgi:alpha-D-xyloside xylohydrolase
MAFQSKYYAEAVLDADVKSDRFFRPAETESVHTADGDVLVRTPLREQKPSRYSNRFEPIGRKTGRSAHFRVRLYEPGIVRLRFSEKPAGFDDDSPMLQFHRSLRKVAAHVARQGNKTLVTDGKRTRFILTEGIFSPVVLPDGRLEIELQDRHHFNNAWIDAMPMCRVDYKSGGKATAVALAIRPDEHFCGTGERFETMDLYGRQISIINDDGLGSLTTRAYKNTPFFVSSRGYGVFVHTPSKIKLDLGCHSKISAQLLIEDTEYDIFFIAGTVSEVLNKYRMITGYPPMVPLWSFGCWQSRAAYHSDEEITTVANRLRREKYPMDVIHIDPGTGLRWSGTGWKVDRQLFPDVEGFFRRLKKMGFHVCLWVFPWIGVGNTDLASIIRRDIVGKPYKNADLPYYDDWYVIDFTNPKVAEWYGNRIREAVRMGADAIKTDFGEKNMEDAQYRKMEGKKYRNAAALYYAKAVWDAGRSAKPDFMLWQRSAWAGNQRYPVHWDGDASSDYYGMLGSIRGGLHFGLSGFAFWSHDIPGFHGMVDFRNVKPPETLYLRWTQFGVFSSHMRYHGTAPREPYEYPKVSGLVREWLRFRYALLPYIVREARKCCTSGLPMLRSMVIDWTNDPAVWSISDQYLFGSDILVCPVANDAGVRSVYLPRGKWVDFWTGKKREGPLSMERVRSPLSRIPLYVRQGATIPFSEPVQHTGELRRAKKFAITFDARYKGFGHSRLSEYLNI